MSTTIPSASSSGASDLDLDLVGGAVQPLGRPERLAAQAVGDHDVIGDADDEHLRGLAGSGWLAPGTRLHQQADHQRDRRAERSAAPSASAAP